MNPLLPAAATVAVIVCTALRPDPQRVAGPSDPHRDPLFTTADSCAVCHIAAPGASAMKRGDDEDVSPYFTWQATMMATPPGP